MKEENKEKGLILTGWIIIALCLLYSSVYTIGAGQKGILLTFGSPSDTTSDAGLHFKVPFIQSVIKFDIKTQKYQADLTAASSDLQDVKTTIAINYHVNPSNVVDIYRNIGVNYADVVIYPMEQEANKATTAQFSAEQLITNREVVKDKMVQLLTDKLKGRGIVIEDISIVDFKFSDSFSQAIEAKVTAEQSALAAKNKLEQVKYEAQQKVEAAKGEAEAITVKASALRDNPTILQLNAIDKWNGVMPQYVGGNAPLPFIQVN